MHAWGILVLKALFLKENGKLGVLEKNYKNGKLDLETRQLEQLKEKPIELCFYFSF